jgi:LAS superfamily LD-carboxypeptidase LdcB
MQNTLKPRLALAIFVIIIVSCVYLLVKINLDSIKITKLDTKINLLGVRLASTTESLQSLLEKKTETISNTISNQQQNINTINQKLGGFENRVGNISGTLNTLQKLSETDPELLKKYSKAYFLNENYVPRRLESIPLAYQYSEHKQLLIHTDVLPFLTLMINSASSTGTRLYVYSAYRSFAEQKALKNSYSVTYGAGTANSFSADQGYSEHQLGTTVDVITPGLGGELDGFDKTAAFQWMINNAYRFGFVMSYPKGNSYYIYEPWHWRFVGIKLATELHNQNKNFYDLDQRTIDGYLVSIFD